MTPDPKLPYLQDLYDRYVELHKQRGMTYMNFEDWKLYCYDSNMGFKRFDARLFDELTKKKRKDL